MTAPASAEVIVPFAPAMVVPGVSIMVCCTFFLTTYFVQEVRSPEFRTTTGALIKWDAADVPADALTTVRLRPLTAVTSMTSESMRIPLSTAMPLALVTGTVVTELLMADVIVVATPGIKSDAMRKLTESVASAENVIEIVAPPEMVKLVTT